MLNQPRPFVLLCPCRQHMVCCKLVEPTLINIPKNWTAAPKSNSWFPNKSWCMKNTIVQNIFIYFLEFKMNHTFKFNYYQWQLIASKSLRSSWALWSCFLERDWRIFGKNFWWQMLFWQRLVESEKYGLWRPEVKIGATWLWNDY